MLIIIFFNLILGDISEWAKCLNAEIEPPRIKTQIPEKLKEKFEFLEKYKSKVTNRIFLDIPPISSTSLLNVKKEDEG